MACFIRRSTSLVSSRCAATNFKVEGGTCSEQSVGKNYFCCVPPLFGSTCTISRFCERFRDGQYIFVCFLFAPWCPLVPIHL